MNYFKRQFGAFQAPGDSVNWRDNLYPLFVVMVVSAIVILPITIGGLPNGADLWNHFRFAIPFFESIQAGVWYPGWLAESNAGLGDPRFRFYPPGLYYLFAVLQFITRDWYTTGIISIVILSIVGGVGAYIWARSFFNPLASMWAGIFYSIAPYRLNEIYQAALLSEYAACTILPFCFAFVERICRHRKLSDVCGLAITYALLLLTHLPMAVIGSLSLAVYALLRVDRKQIVGTLTRLVSSVVLGLAGSAFFWSTMIAELSWIKGNTNQQNNYYDYRFNFLFSPSALTNRNTWYANLLALAVIGFLLPALVMVFKFAKNSRPNLKAVFVLMVGSFLMATPLSRPIWAVIPKLSEVQFPWRWLAITSLATSILVAGSIVYWKERITAWQPRDMAVLLCFVLSLGFIATQVIYDCEYLDRARTQPMFREIRGAVSFKDWLPIWAKEFLQVERMNDKVQAASRTTTVVAWGSERRAFNIEPGSSDTVKLRTYYYPHWTASMNGHILQTSASPDGLLLVKVPAEGGTIDVVFREPTRVKMAAKISAAAWVIMLIGVVFGVFQTLRPSRLAMQQENSGTPEQKEKFSY